MGGRGSGSRLDSGKGARTGRSFHLTMDPALDAAVEEFMSSGEYDSKVDAVRHLLWERLAATPELGALLAAQDRVIFKTRRALIGRVIVAIDEIAQALRTELAALDAAGLAKEVGRTG